MAIKRKVLFLCTGNSCRSQMAEAIVNARLGDRWEASSAGTVPAGHVHPFATRVLAEVGITHHGRSKHADEYRDEAFDLVVTVCDTAAETCPMWLGKGRRVHLGFPDPAHATGTDDEVLSAFRQVRDDIARLMPELLATLDPDLVGGSSTGTDPSDRQSPQRSVPMEIKVLGSGCANCRRLEALAREVTHEMGVDATVEKVTDIRAIMAYRILGTPGLVVDGKVLCAGRVPSKAELTTWVADAMKAAPSS